MKRIAVGWDSGNSDYTEAVMKAWKDKVWSWDIDGVSLHGYTIPNSWDKKGPSVGFGESEYAKAHQGDAQDEGMGRQAIGDHGQYDPDKKLGLYVDEWGIWTDPDPGSNPGFLQQQNTLRDAIIAALNLNIFMRNADRVRGANIAQMINVLQAMILTDGPKMVLTPTYHVYRMYVPFQDATLVPVDFDAGTYTLRRHQPAAGRRGCGARTPPAGCGWRSSMSIRTSRRGIARGIRRLTRADRERRGADRRRGRRAQQRRRA